MARPLSELLLNDSFVRFLNGNSSKEEEARWIDWMQQSDQHAELVEKGRKLLDKGVYTLPKPNAEIEFKRLKRRIQPAVHSEPLGHPRKNSRKLVWAMMGVAASVLLIFGFIAGNSFLLYEKAEQIRIATVDYRVMKTDSGQKTSIQYSGGSMIVLNANSEIKLPQKIAGADTTNVWLEGEALFDIARKAESEARTFIVHTPNGTVSVLGTKFSVNTTNNQSQVVLAEGSVRINVRGEDNKIELEYNMSPGEKALFSQNFEGIQVEQVNTDVYTSWTSNSLVFDNTPFSDVINRIEFTYNIEVKIENEALLDKKLTGRFNHSSLSFLLKGLSEMADLHIEQQQQTVYIKEKN
ncbi:FecR family protein [Rhodohalobacter sp. 8-1]|uniref:FecR family protein n=1 Tax=Rhodohalobacter sp. 8-1 TaxID=3131972 RepID=UPI0030EE03EB